MELRHLRYFVAAAEEQHITRAAKRVGIQQPPLSQQIQQLEQEIGVQLFDRSPRSIRLNASGRLFLGDVRRVLAMADEAVQRVRDFAAAREGLVRIGMTSSSSMHATTLNLVREFNKAWPDVRLAIEEGTNHDLLVMLEQEQLDIAFVRSPPDNAARFAEIRLAEEEMLVCLPLDDAMAAHAEIALTQLIHRPFIRYRQVNGAGIWDKLEQACRDRGFEPRVVDDAQRILSAIHLVGAGIGCTLAPASLDGVLRNAVCFRPLVPEDRITVPLSIVSRAGFTAEPTRKFLDLAARQSGQPVPSGKTRARAR